MTRPTYVELHAHSYYSLLDGVCSPEELVVAAAQCDMPALALTDHDGLYGAVPFIRAAEAAGIKPLLGAEVTLADESHLTLLAETATGYANLCTLLTRAHRDQPKGVARLSLNDLAAHTSGLVALSGCRKGQIPQLILAEQFAEARQTAQHLARLFKPQHFYLEIQRHYYPRELRLSGHLVGLADRLDLPVVATGNVHYVRRAQREVQDLLTATRHPPPAAAGRRRGRAVPQRRIRLLHPAGDAAPPARRARRLGRQRAVSGSLRFSRDLFTHLPPNLAQQIHTT